jgi:hypothetical protein
MPRKVQTARRSKPVDVGNINAEMAEVQNLEPIGFYGPKHIVRVHLTSRPDVKDENIDFEVRIG